MLEGGDIAVQHGPCSEPCQRPFTTCAHVCKSVCHGDKPCGLCTAPCEEAFAHSGMSFKLSELFPALTRYSLQETLS